MRKATYAEKELVTDILCKSFDNNLSVNYIVQQGKKRTKRLKILMAYSFEVCFKFGDIFLSDDNKACALVVYPEKKKTTVSSVLLDINLMLKCIGITNILKALNRESRIKKIQPKERIYYLWFIGVDPKYQGSGIGTELMKEVIEDSRLKKRPLYLETSTLQNLPWYDKFGFKTYNELQLTYKLYFLKRNLET